jgi:hypothetical protein
MEKFSKRSQKPLRDRHFLAVLLRHFDTNAGALGKTCRVSGIFCSDNGQ